MSLKPHRLFVEFLSTPQLLSLNLFENLGRACAPQSCMDDENCTHTAPQDKPLNLIPDGSRHDLNLTELSALFLCRSDALVE